MSQKKAYEAYNGNTDHWLLDMTPALFKHSPKLNFLREYMALVDQLDMPHLRTGKTKRSKAKIREKFIICTQSPVIATLLYIVSVPYCRRLAERMGSTDFD